MNSTAGSTSVHLFPASRSTSKRHSFEVSFKPEEVVTLSNTKQTIELKSCKAVTTSSFHFFPHVCRIEFNPPTRPRNPLPLFL